MTIETIYSTIIGNSAEAIRQIVRLYVPEGARIADLTVKSGGFWKRTDTCRYQLVTSDLDATLPNVSVRCDLRSTPYRACTFGCVVLDPPYGNASTKPRRDHIREQYNLETCMTPKEIKALNRDGLVEGFRILDDKGIMIVKCQPFVDGGRQHWIDLDIYRQAVELGMLVEDRFLMVPPGRPPLRHKGRPQQHARKWGSIFWVFRKKAPPRRRKL